MSENQDRFLVLAEGKLDVFDAKTAASLIRYRPDAVVAVLDSHHAGQTTREVLHTPTAVPVVGTLAEGLEYQPTALVIGISPSGGQLPGEWRGIITTSLRAGLDVISGLHDFLADDSEFRALADQHGCQIIDLRRPPDRQPIAHALAKDTRATRVLTVGTDCNIGKKVTALELTHHLRRRGKDARFVATGQSGVLISGGGVTLDRIAGDFMAGFVEELVVENGEADYVVVEGQGSIFHPAYSGVTAALLHGALPDCMVLCHHATRQPMRAQTTPIPPLPLWVEVYEKIVAPLHPGKVVALSVNTLGLDDDDAGRAIQEASDETGLPATDVYRHGSDVIVEAVLAHAKPDQD